MGDFLKKYSLFKDDFAYSSRKLIVITLLTSGSLAWLFLLQQYFQQILIEVHMPEFFWVELGRILYYGFAVIAAILGSIISTKISRKNLILIWITSGIAATALLVLINDILTCMIISPILGFSLGFGLPSSMATLADYTKIEQRGKIAGITILQTFIMAFLVIAIFSALPGIEELKTITVIPLMMLVRSTSYISYFLDKEEYKQKTIKSNLKKTPYKEYFFYIFPWIMFVIASGIASNMIPKESFEYASRIGTILRMGLLAIFGIIWGIVSDRFGRKPPIIIGLICLGISFGLLGFGDMNENNVIIYLATSGIAWASFLTVYLIIPGDLSTKKSREKTYALGTIGPLIIWFGLAMIPTQYIIDIGLSRISQILSAILFISIIPIMRAKETLPEPKMQQRKMKEYTKKVEKLIEDTKND